MEERIIESSYNGIKVTVRIPLNVREDKKQNRINEIYDILTLPISMMIKTVIIKNPRKNLRNFALKC